MAVAAIEEAKELVDESVKAFKNGNVIKVAFAFYALPHKMKEEDQKRLAELIDAKLGWDVPFSMRFTNRMSWTGYIIFEEKFLTRIKKTFQLSFRFLGREVGNDPNETDKQLNRELLKIIFNEEQKQGYHFPPLIFWKYFH